MDLTTNNATPLKDRALIRIGGIEARAFLQGLLTQNIMNLGIDAPRYGALLTPQGKAMFDMMLWSDPAGGEDVLLDCESASAEALIRRLSLYRLRRPVTIAPEDVLSVHWSPEPTHAAAPDPRLPVLGWRWLAPAGEGDASDLFRAHRLAQGVPEGVAELGQDKTLWLECNAEELGGVDYTKGCYIGQENTARMHYRNKVNRRLVVLPLEYSDPARQRMTYPELGLAIDHRPVDSLDGVPLADWLVTAIAETAQ